MLSASTFLPTFSKCTCTQRSDSFEGVFTSIDSWDELLDPPLEPAIIRTHGNWAARFAAICVLKQNNLLHRTGLVSKKTPCLACLRAQHWDGRQKYAFFID